MLLEVLIQSADAIGVVILAASSMMSGQRLIATGDPDAARPHLIAGVLTALMIQAVSAVLKTIMLRSWEEIGHFLVIVVLRTILKHVFRHEAIQWRTRQ